MKHSTEKGQQGKGASDIGIISVFDNCPAKEGLKISWGFSSIVKSPGMNLLFDVGGDADILLSNMDRMDIHPRSIDAIFLSHIHEDHTEGLQGFLKKQNELTVYIPSSFPKSIKDMIISAGAEYEPITDYRKITDVYFSTGEITGPPEEQALIISSQKGLILMTGCCHPGIVKVVRRTKELFPEQDVYLVVGGFHHPPASSAEKLKDLGVEKIAPSHCTGDSAIEAFKNAYGTNFISYGVGKIIKIRSSN